MAGENIEKEEGERRRNRDRWIEKERNRDKRIEKKNKSRKIERKRDV